jgi:hypothetical protein
MTQVNLLFANKQYDNAKQAVAKNQIVQMKGYGYDRYIVYDITEGHSGLIYRLINLRTREFGQCDLIRPLSEKFGIGYYYDDEKPEFMDAVEVLALCNEAEYKAREEQEARQKQQERDEQLKAIGRERLKTLIPENAKAVVVAELHEDESDSMTDYYGYRTQRTVILGFSGHTKDLFSEMRKHASNFEETAYLAEENKDYEHREKFIERFALVADDETNICVKVQETGSDTPETVGGDFIIVDYSEKALAVFGDTRPVKDQLKALGGRFNPKLTHEGEKQAGWIFSLCKTLHNENNAK